MKSIEELKLKEYKKLFYGESEINDLSYQFLKENFLDDIIDLYEGNTRTFNFKEFLSENLREALFNYNQENGIYKLINFAPLDNYKDNTESSFRYFYFDINETEKIILELIERYEND